MEICIFEDLYFDRIEPLTFSRPTYDLVCGISSLKEKIIRQYPDVKISLHTRPYLESFLISKYSDLSINKIEDDDCLFINGRILAPGNLSELIPLKDKTNKVFVNKDDTLIAARVSGKMLNEVKNNIHDLLSLSNFDGVKIEKIDIPCANYVWDLINNNHKEMVSDYSFLTKSKQGDMHRGKVYEGAHLIEKENIYIAEGAQIKPGAVLDASPGPIYLDENSVIFPNAVIEGPVYVGKSSQVKSCARIYENVSIGNICKVGGEVEDSIISPFTNKQHSGFLGHAYLGSWVNIGADTNCSDLKNNYGSVKMYVNGEVIDSGSQFLGVIIGDQSKTAINTMFNTGSVVGFACNVYGAGFPPKYLPSFSWGGSDAVTTYDIARSLETAKRVMARRNKIMDEAEEKLFRKIFDLTQKERRKRGYPY